MKRKGGSFVGAADEDEADPVIGLARNPPGVKFCCGECKFFKEGICRKPKPKLYGTKVDPVLDCCDFYKHPKMKILIP